MAAIPALVIGQLTTWEGQTAAGNSALADSLLPQATLHFRTALGFTAAFPEEDLRLPTAIRNLAHVLTLSGAYSEADSLYRDAIRRADQLLPEEHLYPQTLRAEYAALLDAIRRSGELDRDTSQVILTFWDVVRIWGIRIGNITTFQTGPVIPLGAPLDSTHKAALLHIVTFAYPLSDGGFVVVTANLERIAARLPAERGRFSPAYSILGLGAGLGLRVGKLGLQAGLGFFNLRVTSGREFGLGLTAGAGFIIWDTTSRHSQPGFRLDLRANILRLPVAPGIGTGVLLAGGGLSMGYYW